MGLRTWTCGMLAVITAVAGCSRQDTDKLSGIGRIAAARAGESLDELRREHFPGAVRAPGKGKASVGLPLPGGELARRVQARLRDDARLAGGGVEVAASGTQVELTGTVRDLAQRRRAVELAETTVGVTKVQDKLRIEKE